MRLIEINGFAQKSPKSKIQKLQSLEKSFLEVDVFTGMYIIEYFPPPMGGNEFKGFGGGEEIQREEKQEEKRQKKGEEKKGGR